MNWELLSTFYRKTTYKIFVSETKVIDLRIDTFTQDLNNLLIQSGHEAGCLLTAYNPRSIELPDVANITANKKLVEELKQRGLQFLPGEGIGDFDPSLSKQWQSEPSFFVFVLNRAEALALGEKYQQNAVVYCAKECAPELLRCLFD